MKGNIRAFVLLLVVGIVSSLLVENIIISSVISLVCYLVYEFIDSRNVYKPKERTGYASLDDIVSLFDDLTERIEARKTPHVTYLNLVNAMILIDESNVEWKLDPLELVPYNETERLGYDGNMQFKISFN